MQSLRERVPQPLPRQGPLERLATARRLIQPEYMTPDLAEPQPVANDRSASDSDPAWPLDDAASPESARSALSAPENFIAEGQFKALLHRHFGRKRWPVLLVGVVIAGAAAASIGLDLPAFFPRTAIVAKDQARGSAELSGRSDTSSVGVPKGEAPTANTASAPQPHQDPAAEPAAPATGANFQRRLATAGLPDADATAVGATDASVTAFPPNAAVEQDRPSTEPPAAEPAVTETHEPAAAEASPTKALPPQPNPKLDALFARAEQLLAAGEITKARQFFGRIAADGDSRGALGMARSYDEQVLRELPGGARSANPAQATSWYEQARGMDPTEQPDRGNRTSAAR